MKNMDLTKTFLIVILAVTWIMSINYCMSAIVQKDGYEAFVAKIHSFPDGLAISVAEEDSTPEETYRKLEAEWKDNENVTGVMPLYEWVNMGCEELEEETGRSVTLRGRIFHEAVSEALPENLPDKLEVYEVLLPKYFAPCDIGKYGDKSYMDAESWVGKTLTVTGYKADWDREQGLVTEKDEQYSVTLKVAGVYDNTEMGMEGNHILYSYETYKKIIQEKFGLSGQETENYIEQAYQFVQVYPKNLDAKEAVLAELKEAYGEAVYEDVSVLNLSQYDQVMTQKEDTLQVAVILCSLLGVSVAVALVVLLRKQMRVRALFGWQSLIAAAGLVFGCLVNYRFVREQNALCGENPENVMHFLSYPMVPVYIAAGLSAVCVIVGVLVLCGERKGKKGERNA